MAGMISEILAALAVAILRYLHTRSDLKASIRNDLIVETMAYANNALKWKARAAGDTHLPELLVRRPGYKIFIPGDPANFGGRPEAGPLSDPGSGRTDLP